ncbi:hypothetical protein NLG97_g1661 [Lecanicillium saksenae]|uniref:Uncharacterized protein n=1 Tax=Lecanicillium saksenae TaxID=468837 RepID=A0ACC1R5S0_9HYPO|nr:hypothetical protein NLG97_g1661 [Lecanicillium saksenae]
MLVKIITSTTLVALLVAADEKTYGVNAICNNDQLMRWLDKDRGLWRNSKNDLFWWESANILTTFANLAKLDNSVLDAYGDVFDTVYKNAPNSKPVAKVAKRAGGFQNDFYDDEGWWGLAWVAALDVTGRREYLDEAISIWYDMDAAWGKHHCGGIPWNKNGHSPVSIANELYIALGAALSNRVGLDMKPTFVAAAKKGWDWFSKSGVLGSDHLIRDGLDDNCQVSGDYYTYNQGVIIGGLVELWKSTGELAWIDTAENIARAVTAPGSIMQDGSGLLADGCDKEKSCQGLNDGTIFKGIFARNLQQLHAIRPNKLYKAFLQKNAQSIWQTDLKIADGGCFNGVLWGGPYVAASAASQSSALDCLVAAQAATNSGTALRPPSYTTNEKRASAVKEAFAFSWKGYLDHAFPHDSLKPVDNTYVDDRNGWGASAVDALSTAIIMRDQAAVDKILNHIATINFDSSSTDVSFFETSIRYLAGMLSGYDLLDGPFSDLINGNKSQLQPILSQARRLADNLKVAYNTPSGININGLEFHGKGKIIAHKDQSAGIAGVTLPIEWQRLSDLTDNPEYGNLNRKAVAYFLTPYPQSNQPFPGLIGQNFDPLTGHSQDASGGWGGGSDSDYEYLIKSFIYDKTVYEKYKERWELAAESSIRFLASSPSSRSDLTWLAGYNNQSLSYDSQHLACFAGGNFILGGLTLGKQEYVDFGLKLTDSCHETYTATHTGIGPENWHWRDIARGGEDPQQDQHSFYNQHGFWVANGQYNLRPEVIESYYYAYRATGDSFAALKDIQNPSKGFNNLQESYFFAEVLKYSYLIHAEDGAWQVKADQTNQFVYNTEAHPIRINKNAMG